MSTITQISPDKFSIQDYTFEDYNIVPNFEVTSIFEPSGSIVEYFIYDANSNLISSNYNFPGYSFTEDPSITNLGGFSTMDLNPEEDLINTGYDVGQYNVVYNFFENQLNSDVNSTFYISEISTNRTEIKLESNVIQGALEAFPSFKESLEGEDYFNEFYLNFGDNQIIIAVNATIYEGSIVIKLYDPLPPTFNTKSTCWVTLKISDPVAYNVDLISPIEEIDSVPFLKGPNTNIQIQSEINNSTDLGSLNDIVATTLTSSFQQVNSLLNEKGISINVDYTDFNNFIQYSSAEQRLLNFYTKVSQIEDNTNDLINFDFKITGSSSSSFYVSESKASSQHRIDNIIKNFDGYEYYLYFDSSSTAWPKQNAEPPFILYSTGSTEVLNWIGNSVEGTIIPNNTFPYGPYGGMALSASQYDAENENNLLYAMPEFVLNDSQNEPYQLFVEMLGQHFDNIWIYLKDVTNKFDADNRLNFGISKDLVAQAVRDFGLKIYQNQFSSDNLYSAFLGITPSGSLLPYTGSELITTYVTASSDITPLDDVNKSIYKRLYHNLPYLLKKKGTIQGIKGLIASYGIPNTILRVSEFGGKDRDNSNDWDYWYNKFNYGFYTSGSNFVSSNFEVNSTWGAENRRPSAVEFRFKSDEAPTEHFTQSLWSTDNGIALNLEYENSGLTSGSYSGSIVSTYKDYGYLRLYPDPTDLTVSASVYLPLFDDGWWSVLINSGSTGYDLYAKNKIYIGDDASYIGFQASSSIQEVNTLWENAATSTFASGSNEYFSGSLQEIRYYKPALSESVFDDYVQNPLSSEGNTLNSSPLELIFRAPLGSELDSGSLESVHPKITGSWEVTQSFQSGNSNFAYNTTPIFVPNTEYIFLDQPAAGIRNRITDKVKVGTQILPSGSNQTLSQYRSIEQQLPLSQSFTPDVNSIEVAFSPQNEINDDIIEQIGYFNLGEKIGDNRYNFYTRSTNPNFYEFTKNQNVPYRTDYQDLTQFSREYFEKYTSNYNAFDYIRLIRFFDNSLFKMIKDFVPAKSSLSSGVVIKQHLLERSRYPHVKVNPTTKIARVQGTGSADDTMVDYNVKDLALSGSVSIGSIKGGAGGGPNVYNQIANNPYEQSIGTELPSGIPVTNLTQSFTQSLDTIGGTFETIDSKQEEFYNGEYSGSEYVVEDGELSPGCFVYLHGLPNTIAFTASVFNNTSSVTDENRFIDPVNTPMVNGYTYFYGNGPSSSDSNVELIRISKYNNDGEFLTNELSSLNSISSIADDVGPVVYRFNAPPTDLGTDLLYRVSNAAGFPTYTNNVNIDRSFGVGIDLGPGGQFNINAEIFPTQSFTINYTNDPNYLDKIFFPLSQYNTVTSTNIAESGSVVDFNFRQTQNFPTSSMWDSEFGEFLNFYTNNSMLDMQSGYVLPTFTSLDNVGWSGFPCTGAQWDSGSTAAFAQFCIIKSTGFSDIAGGGAHDSLQNRVIIADPTNAYRSFVNPNDQRLSLVASPFDDADFPATVKTLNPDGSYLGSDLDIRYYFGFVFADYNVVKSSFVTGRPAFIGGATVSFGGFSLGADFNQQSPTGSAPNYRQGSAFENVYQSNIPGDFLNSDCDVLQGNATEDRPGTLYYDVDYATSQYTAINEEAILNGTAPFASVQNSNYTTLSQINPRYKGSRSTSPKINVWAPTTAPDGITYSSVNTFGKEPTVSRTKTFFAYFDFINGTSPELNDKTIAHVQFLVDQDGNTIPPDSSSLYITQNSFQTGETVFVNLDDPLRFETPMNKLNGGKTVIRGGERVDALLYSDSGSTFAGADGYGTSSFGNIQFDTGSFQVTDYQFTAQNTGSIVDFPQNQTGSYHTYPTGSVGANGFGNPTQTNAQYDSTNGKFTFTSDTDTPVKFKATITSRFLYATGDATFFIVKNYTPNGTNTNPPTSEQILDSQNFGGSFGSTYTYGFNLDTGFQNFENGDTVQVIFNSTFVSSYLAEFNTQQSDVFQSINQINPNGTADPMYWNSSSVNWDRLWLSGSEAISAAYGSKQIQTWEQSDVNGTNDPRPEFDPIIQDFTVEVGDEIRFNGVESYTRMISAVKLPSEESDGLLKILLNDSMSTAANEQHFLLRRYVEDASYVLLDSNKPDGSTSPGTVISEFVTKKLTINRDAAVSQIIESNAGS